VQPATPAQAQLAAYARQVYPTIDRVSYYQLLRVAPNADARAIRAAYYSVAAQLHPDRYFNLADTTLRSMLETIYARISEGYRVLSEPQKRATYDRNLPAGKLRYEAERAPNTPKNPEDSLKGEQAKKFYRLGLMALAKKDWKSAVMNFNFAKNMEPSAAVILEKLAEAQAGLKAAAPPPK
jgi:curved DNA-binding protein CbpA